MQLMMYLGNDHIETVKLDPDRVSKPGYLGTFKRNLKQKYKDMISEYGSSADFIVVGEMNQTYSDKINNIVNGNE